jgi:RimJ/RimL family protein N-acetyltransferase
MTDARDFVAAETLRNGAALTIRAIRPDDRDRISRAFRALERESVYSRFFSLRNEPTAAELSRLDTIDFVREVILVATIEAGGDETIIGSATYVALTDVATPHAAEIAFVVEEDYQGLGIASRLLKHLAALARERGITTFVADVLPGNKAMLSVFAKSGLPTTQRLGNEVIHVVMKLTAAA